MMKSLKILFGPLPLLPFYGTFFTFIVSIYGEIHFAPRGPNQLTSSFLAIAPAMVTALSVGIPLYLTKLTLREGISKRQYLVRYYVGLILVSVSYTYFQRLPFIQSFQETREIFGIFTSDYIRNIMPITFLANVIGYFYLKLHSETEAKQAALTMVQAQNEVLIESEERSRSSVAQFLHDRVQAALVTVSMQLGEISENLPAKSKARISSVISEIEHIRRVDVRSAAQRLSPDLAVIGLVSALKLNTEALTTSVRTRVITDKSVEDLLKPSVENEHLQLGIYRIVEQVMLNAVIHGRAQNITISFTLNDRKLITVVTNDGKELGPDNTPGSGTAVISSWLSILNGSYKLENTSNEGVRFVMKIPV